MMPRTATVRRVRRNADRTIRALRDAGRLEDVDALIIALLRTSADNCDELRGVGAGYQETNALRLTGELEARLREVGGPSLDAFDQLLLTASSPSPPGHSS